VLGFLTTGGGPASGAGSGGAGSLGEEQARRRAPREAKVTTRRALRMKRVLSPRPSRRDRSDREASGVAAFDDEKEG
jgi:hypothetical protein